MASLCFVCWGSASTLRHDPSGNAQPASRFARGHYEMLAGRIGFIDAIQVLLLPLLAGRNLADSAEVVMRQHRERVR